MRQRLPEHCPHQSLHLHQQMEHDVIIIGGGPGGSSAATYLRMKGHSVLVLEKEKFPREHVGESLIPFCWYHLRDMGLLEKVGKFATRKPGINFVDKDGARQSVWCFERIIKDGAGNVFHTARAPFDKTLLDHAGELGAEVIEECVVKECDLTDSSKVVVRALHHGIEKVFTAKFLIDASGQHSFLAGRNKDRHPYEGLDRVAFYRRWTNNNYDKALNAGLIKLVYLGGEKLGWFWVIPIGRNYLSVGVSLNNEYVREQKKKFTGTDWKDRIYMQELSEATCLKDILSGSVAEHETLAVSDYSFFVRNKFGENWAMVGDSGAFLDPIFSSGLFVAMETAKRVTDAIDVKLRRGNEEGKKIFEETFSDIEGGYKLIEKFVRLFYNPELLKFSHIGPADDGYGKFTNAYNIFHYLMSGDFFRNYRKYTEFIDTLNEERSFNKFIHYARTKADEFPDDAFCHHSFEEIYGHLPEDDTLIAANNLKLK
jgi:flavin-dependent dehydrogenase